MAKTCYITTRKNIIKYKRVYKKRNKILYEYVKKNAFTLAETLITIGIIGLVIAMTIPALINNINDKHYDVARQKALTSIGEAGRLLAVEGEIGSASSAEDFVKNYLSKKLKIIKICSKDDFQICGLSAKFKTLDGKTKINMPVKFADLGIPSLPSNSTWYPIKNNESYGFLTVNGYSANLFYNPNCTNTGSTSGYACLNIIYDMNGLKNPNQVGKDIGFITVIYPNEQSIVVAPNPTPIVTKGTYNWNDAQLQCSNLGKEYTIPDKEELLSMAINGKLLGNSVNLAYVYWSSSKYKNPYLDAWAQSFDNGVRGWFSTTLYHVSCVKR